MSKDLLKNLSLERPLAFLDLEATGISPRADRIVELAIIRVDPDGSQARYVKRVNPQVPIPKEAAEIHGIYDEDVADCPSFADIAEEVIAFLGNADIGGYNIARYDIPMLQEEFLRAGVAFDADNRRVVDVQTIFHKHEPRDLSAALAFFCDELHLDAHGAEADVLATMRVLEGQYARYNDVPRTVDEMDAYCNPRDPAWVDRMGRLKWVNGEVALNFGKKKGTPLAKLIAEDANFIRWMLRSDFPRDTLTIVSQAIEGKWPEPPPTPPCTDPQSSG